MTTPQAQAPATPPLASTSDGTWGAPVPPQKWSGRKTAAAGAIAAVVAVGGGAAIWAASSSSTDTSAAAQGGQFGGQPPGGMAAGGAGALSSALHGEYVVADGSGGYTTQLTQTGKVTAISATSLTAQSDDGFSKSYTIASAQATGVVAGDTVTVVATTTGTTATVQTVTEGSAVPAGRQAPPAAGH